jgi:AcrR family transcriptional regulator
MMPKIVDHEARREMVAAATLNVIARSGLANTTIREIAREARVSNGVLAHYFADKHDILVSALRMSHGRVGIRMRDCIGEREGLAALRIYLLEALPLDADRVLEAHVEVSCSSLAAADPALAGAQRDDYEFWWGLMRRRIQEAQGCREVRARLDPDDLTHAFMVLINGLSLEAVMQPKRATPARQLALLGDALGRIATPSGQRLLARLDVTEPDRSQRRRAVGRVTASVSRPTPHVSR